MKIFFDSANDGRSWPTWHSAGNGCAGEVRLGLLGLLGHFETLLGSRGPEIPEAVRVASLVPTLKERPDLFCSRSAEVDPFGVARSIISLNDFLILHGWLSQPVSSRLSDLAQLSDQILPGIAHRLQAVLADLEDFDEPMPKVVLQEDVENLPLLWRKLFRLLREKGAELVVDSRPTSGCYGNDLCNARKSAFSPVNDGSLQLVRPNGLLRAAEEIAAWLAAVMETEGLQETVIVGGDAVLDNALRRFGVPVVGAPPEAGNALMELLPLVLAMGLNPPDPERVMELLSLPVSPVPSSIGRKLRHALCEWPALGSHLWQEKLHEGLTAIEDEERRARVEERLTILFTPVAGEKYTVGEIQTRVNMLITWLGSYLKDDPTAHLPIGQCQLLLDMLEIMRLEEVDEPLLQKLMDEVSANEMPPVIPAQAGIVGVARADDITGPAKRIVWWNFTRASVPALSLPIFSQPEAESLRESGVFLPDSAVLAEKRALRWRRPLEYAEAQLVLVCPAQDRLGEDLHPHPLWDELMAASEDKAKLLVTEKIQSKIPLPSATPEALPLPLPVEQWHVPEESVQERPVESPSGLETLLGCSFKWCLQYGAVIRSAHMTTLPGLTRSLGKLIHELVAQALSSEQLPAPETGSDLAKSLFDRKAPQLVAALFQRGMEAEKEKARNTIALAMRSLLQHFHDAGVTKVAVEQKLSTHFGSQLLEGYADVVVDAPLTIVDLKSKGTNFYREKLKTGTALQLAAYAYMLKEMRGVYPQLAYFVLSDQSLLTTDANHFSSGEVVETMSAEEMWKIVEESVHDMWGGIKSGVIPCPGTRDEEIKSCINVERLVLEPPCRFCDYDALCGRRYK